MHSHTNGFVSRSLHLSMAGAAHLLLNLGSQDDLR